MARWILSGIFLVCVVVVCEALSQECSPGESKHEDCNACTCSGTGEWLCTRKFCIQKRSESEFSCTPGQQFQKECNSCTCTPDGKNAICTLKNCTDTETPEEKTTE